MYHIVRGSLKGSENENRCPKTGYVDAGALENAGGKSGARRYDADCGGDDLRSEPTRGKQMDEAVPGGRLARLAIRETRPPPWWGTVECQASGAHPGADHRQDA